MRLALSILLALLTLHAASAQDYVPRDERGSLDARAQTDLDGNRAVATVYNFGQSGRTGGFSDQVPYEWPAGTRQHYLALTGLLVGAEVESETGAPAAIVNIPNYRENPNDPDRAWTWIPVPEYQGGGEIARSDRPETWPAVWPDRLGDASDPGWPGAWNGLLGKDAIIDGVETYTHYTDDQYDRNRQSPATTYIPDATEPDRAGLGLVVAERRLAFREPAVQDAHFAVRDIYNAGTQDLTGVGAALWIADLVGGDPDAQDDVVLVDRARRLILFTDADGESPDPAFGGEPVSAAALVLLETPDAGGFANVQLRPAGGVNFQSTSDQTLFDSFLAPADFPDPEPSTGDDDTFAAVGLFDLAAGASARLATALVFSDVDYTSDDFETRYAELIGKAEAARLFYADGFVVAGEGGAEAVGLDLGVAPNPARETARIRFSVPTAQAARLDVIDALGRRVATLADGAYAAGSHAAEWNAASAAPGVYLLRLRAADGVATRTMTVAR